MGGYVSGAVYNPAVGLALAITGKLDWKKFGFFSAANVAGGIVGMILGQLLHDNKLSYPMAATVPNAGEVNSPVCIDMITLVFTAKVLVLSFCAHCTLKPVHLRPSLCLDTNVSHLCLSVFVLI